jgi:hypothetical protein
MQEGFYTTLVVVKIFKNNANHESLSKLLSNLLSHYQNMGISEEIQIDIDILHEDPNILMWFLLGPICLICGVILIGAPSPNLAVGFPFFTIGMAMCFFGLTRYFNIKTVWKLNEMNERLDRIERMVKKWDFD